MLAAIVLEHNHLLYSFLSEEIDFRLFSKGKLGLKQCEIEELVKIATYFDVQITHEQDHEKLFPLISTKKSQDDYASQTSKRIVKILQKIFSFLITEEDYDVDSRKLDRKQSATILSFLKSSLIKEVINVTQDEIEKRKEKSSSTSLTEDPIKALENAISFKEIEIKEIMQNIEQKRNDIDESKLLIKEDDRDLKNLKSAFESQSKEIQEIIDVNKKNLAVFESNLKEKVSKSENALKTLSGNATDIQNTQDEIRKMEAKMKDLQSSYQKALNEHHNFQLQKASKDGELKAVICEKETVSEWKSIEEKKLEIMKTLLYFAKEVHLSFKEDKSLFQIRIECRNQVKNLRLSNEKSFRKRLKEFYSFLTSISDSQYFQQFKTYRSPSLNLSIENAIVECDIFLFEEIMNIVSECVEAPELKWVHTSSRCELTGFNLSIAECLSVLKEGITSLLFPLNLKIDPNNNVKVIDCDSFPGFAGFPSRFLKLIKDRIKVFYLPVKGVWKQLTMAGSEASKVFESLEIDYYDILKVFIDTCEFISGNDIYLDVNTINFPGISLVFHALKKIYVEVENDRSIEIITSGKDGKLFRASLNEGITEKTIVARSGSFYRERIRTDIPDVDASLKEFAEKANIFPDLREAVLKALREALIGKYGSNIKEDGWPTGLPGDPGRNGLPGQCAGDIFLKAEWIDSIMNIKFIAKGGNGAFGQTGGEGDEGKTGVKTPDAFVNDTKGFGRRQLNISWARIPGLDENGNLSPQREKECGGSGGDGGQSGLGGHGGQPGEIHIDTQHKISFVDRISILGDLKSKEEQLKSNFLVVSGNQGEDGGLALGGDGGKPGDQGADRQLFKPSFWNKTREKKGRLKIKVLENPYGGSRTLLDLDFSIFPTTVEQFGFCEDYALQININGSGDEQEMVEIDGRLLDQERLNRQGKGKRGNANRNNKRSEATRKKDVKTENIARQQHHQLYLARESKSLSNTKRWNECKERFERNISRVEAEIASYDIRISSCESSEYTLNQVIENIKSNLNEVGSRVEQLGQAKSNLQNSLNMIRQSLEERQGANIEGFNSFLGTQREVSAARMSLQETRSLIHSKSQLQEEFKALSFALSNSISIQKSSDERFLKQQKLDEVSLLESLKIAQSELSKLQSDLERELGEKNSKEKFLLRTAEALNNLKDIQKSNEIEVTTEIQQTQLLLDLVIAKKDIRESFEGSLNLTPKVSFVENFKNEKSFILSGESELLIKAHEKLKDVHLKLKTAQVDEFLYNDIIGKFEFFIYCIVNLESEQNKNDRMEELFNTAFQEGDLYAMGLNLGSKTLRKRNLIWKMTI